tara:strand:+ start:14277 stop:16532 length:2256 start_codon:yes stop_codon:yes gene_type:complete
MILENVRGKVRVRHRDNSGQRIVTEITDSDFDTRPYCFVKTKNAHSYNASSKEDGYKGLYGEELTKLSVPKPYDIKEIKDRAERFGHLTWECNIPFVNRVMSDRVRLTGKRIPNYEHRIWYLDCEWSPATNKMRVIVVNDSFTDKEYVWFVDSSLELSQNYSEYGGYKYDTPAKAFPNERLMLVDFVKHMEREDPDVLAGWYVTGADIKQIFERCQRNGIEPRGMSPLRRIKYDFKDWAQPIAGRMCIDLMLAVSKLWELKNGKLSGYSLDNVSSELLGEKKIELPDGHDTYLSDLPLYLHYARQDVRLLPKLDLKVNAINHYLALQHLIQCDIQTTPFITKMFNCLALQDKDWDRRIPTKPQFAKIDFEGANVMEVKSGVHDNVGILDIKAMYHSNAELHNISWETLDNEGEDCGNGTKFTKVNGMDGLRSKGMLVRQMDNMTYLREEYKLKMMMSDTDSKKERYDIMQFACKSLVASMYGVAGDAKYGMYHPQIAAAITFTSRQTLDKLKVESEKLGLKVLYGHTDSVFVQSDERMDDTLMTKLNDSMSPIVVQFEKWCDRMILMAKNRYAGNVIWSDGSNHPPKLYIKGIEMKQSRMPTVMKNCMTDVIGAILENKSEQESTDKVKELIVSVVTGEADPRSLCMKGKLDRDMSNYKVLSGGVAGAAWANEFLGKGYRKGDFFLVTLNESGKYMAFDDPKEIEGKYKIGYKKLADRFIIKKIIPYYELMGWNVQPLYNAVDGIDNLVWV